MTEDNANNKLTLSSKSTLTLKGLGDKGKSHERDGKKIVQVEVRKKRFINPTSGAVETKVEIDDATAAKLRLIAEAKEFESKKKQDEEEKAKERQKQRELEEVEKANNSSISEESEEAVNAKSGKSESAHKSEPIIPVIEEDKSFAKAKDKKSKEYDEEDEEDSHKLKKAVADKVVSKEETFEQERKKVMKRSFEPQRRGGKFTVNAVGGSEEDEDDYGFGGRRRYKKKQPKPAPAQQTLEKVIKEVVIPEVITVQELADRKSVV